MIDNFEWLNSLKVGDEVIVGSSWNQKLGVVTAINKVTIKVGNSLYNKRNGFLRGQSYNSTFLLEATEQRKAKVRLASLRSLLAHRIKNMEINSLTAEQIMKINTVLDEVSGDKEERK